MEKYDVIIIGAGVTGTAVARELSRYQIKTCVLEREEDVCCGTSKANSAIIHAGYDAEPGTLKAKLNVRGNLLIGELAEKLDFPFKRNGSLVLCLDEKDYPNLQKLYEKGITNGVKKLRILNHDEVLEMEPNVSENVYAALYAPTGGIVCPFNMTIAFAENACVNGVEFRFDTEVLNISRISSGTENWKIKQPVVIMKQNVFFMQLESMLIVFIIWSAKRKFILYHVKVNTVSLTKVRAAM